MAGGAYVTLLVSKGSWGTSADRWTHSSWWSITSFVLTYFHSPLNVSCFHESSPSAVFSCECFLSPRCCTVGYFSNSLRTTNLKKKMEVEKTHAGMILYFPCTCHTLAETCSSDRLQIDLKCCSTKYLISGSVQYMSWYLLFQKERGSFKIAVTC